VDGKANPAHLDEIRVENYLIQHLDSTGIWSNGDRIPNPHSPDWETAHNTRVLIAHNRLEDIGKMRSTSPPRSHRSSSTAGSTTRMPAIPAMPLLSFGDQNAEIAHNEVSGTRLINWDDAAYDGDFNSIGTSSNITSATTTRKGWLTFTTR
jgi:hypothetical protein